MPKINLKKRGEIPPDAVICGASRPQQGPKREQEKVCERCSGPCFVSNKNAHFIHFICTKCALKEMATDKDIEVATTAEDIQEFKDHLNREAN